MEVEAIQPGMGIEKQITAHTEKHTQPLLHEHISSRTLQEHRNQDKEKIASAAKAVESYLRANNTNLKFIFTDKEKIQVEIIEADTKRLIRKIPSDEMLSLAESIEEMTGVFMNKKL